jgi:hypothetical protein
MTDARSSDAVAGAADALLAHATAGPSTSGGGVAASGRVEPPNPGRGCAPPPAALAPLEPPDDPTTLVGRRVLRAFGDALYEGRIVLTRHTQTFGMLWRVVYEDGDSEDMDWHDMRVALQPKAPAPGAAAATAAEAAVRSAPPGQRATRQGSRDAMQRQRAPAGGDDAATAAHACGAAARKLSLKEMRFPRPAKDKPRSRGEEEEAHHTRVFKQRAAQQPKPKAPAKQQAKKQQAATQPKKQLQPRKAASAGKKHVAKARALPELPKRHTALPQLHPPPPPGAQKQTQTRGAAHEAAGITTRSVARKRGRSPVRAGPPGPLPGRPRAAAKVPRVQQQQPASAAQGARQAAGRAGAAAAQKPHRAAAKKARRASSRSSSQPPPAPQYTYNPFAPPPSPSPSPSSSSPSSPAPPEAHAMVAVPWSPALLAHEGGCISAAPPPATPAAPPAAPSALHDTPPQQQLALPEEARGADALAAFLCAIRPPLAQLGAVLAALPSSGATLAHVDRIAAAQLSCDASAVDADDGGALKLLALKDLAGALGIRTACDRAVFATAALERGARRRAAARGGRA